TVTLIPNGIHHPPIEDGRLLPNSVKSDLASRDYFSETIQPGKSAQGTAYFEVKNDGTTFEVFFADTSWKGSY
ncbi:hypothetical protein SKA15_11880, partial [Enterococcus faecium]